MISSPWLLLVVGALGASATMIVVWLVSIRIRNASYVDVTWALGIAGTAVAYALLADGSTLHRVLVAGLGTVWGVRLGTYLLARLAGSRSATRPAGCSRCRTRRRRRRTSTAWGSRASGL